MNETQTAVAESSPAEQTFEVPSDPAANLEWRKTGNVPEAKPKEDSTPSTKASAAASKDGAVETAPASATGTQQEKPKNDSAETRLTQILADLKKAGLSPAELKTFKREAAAAAAEPPAKAAPEQTAKPQGLEKPVKPTQADKNGDGTPKYDSWEKLEAARDEYFEKLSAFNVATAVAEDRAARAAEAQQNVLKQKVTEAKARYGEDAMTAINKATAALDGDANLNPVIRAMCDDSKVLVDVMYVLGSKPEDLAEFVEMAKAQPGLAVRKFALLEHLVQEELAKGSTAATAAAGTQRGEDGKFVSEKTPATKKPAAPPPPDELNSRGSAPTDALDAATRDNNARAFIDEENRRDIAKRRGA